ncbi:uncharacterized protein [Argopecten irradians]|uniref:uncharacterized protein n=1 Tax=Argopecten irradians TaxID=31199 RepID=UPI003718E89E
MMTLSLLMIGLLMITLLSTATCTHSNIWKENVTEVNLIYNDGVTFSQQSPSAISCARICLQHSACLDITYTITTEECRGYNGMSNDSISQGDTRMWRRLNVSDDSSHPDVPGNARDPTTCLIPGYTYDPDIGVCIRLYTTQKTWQDAALACSQDSAYLLILDTMKKMNATKFGIHREQFLVTNDWWVGGYDYDDGPANDFRWSNNESIAIPSDIWFAPSIPDKPGERCVNHYVQGFFGLNDNTCAFTLFYACQEIV